MRVQPQKNGMGTWETGFRRIGEGWHEGKFDEGIDYLKSKKDGEETISTNKQGDKNWKIPTIVSDENDEFYEVKYDIIVAENQRGEQMVADILGCTGLFEKFKKKFTKDESVFDPEVIKLIMTQLPNQFWRFKITESPNKNKPDEPYINIVGFGKMSDTIASLDAALFPDKKGHKSVGKAGKAADKPEVDEADPFA